MASNLSNIRDEDLLRRMWQETEDFGRKKEIRQHMYKLRESRLKDFYTNEMDSKNTFNPKAPITSRHGDAMADHSFESFKSQEIRDSKSPSRDLKFGMSGNTGGWNVISSSEVSGDGKNRTDQMLATTEGVSAVKGGTKAFVGKNEEMKTEKYDGDDKNFTYSTGESSNMVLNENIVTGDDRNRRTENKSSSVSHSSNIVKSSTNSGINDNDMQQQLLDDNVSRQSSTNTNRSSSTSNNKTTNQHSSSVSSSNDNNSSRNDNNSTSNDNNSNFNSNANHVMSAADQQRLNQQLSKESGQVQEAFRLAQQPGNVISHTVERANPTTNMITEKKELADGTIVTTKRYETINSDNVDNQTSRNVSTDNTTRSNINKSNTTQSQNYANSSQTTKNVNQTTKINTRDEEAFRQAEKQGTVISRNVEMSDPTTRMITEKKELADGTIVTTKKYEKITSENTQSRNSNTNRNSNTFENTDSQNTSRDTNTNRNSNTFENTDSQNTSRDTNTASNNNYNAEHVNKTSTNVNQTFKSSRDEEAFRLADKQGTVLSRNVEMSDPTTRMITEKKQLADGTIVTTKKFEKITSENTQSRNSNTNRNSNTFENTDTSRDTKNTTNDKFNAENIKKTINNVNETFKSSRDEEAFRLAEKQGTVLSRNVEMTDPTTRMITEKKQLADGTVVTTKKYENITASTDNNNQYNRNINQNQKSTNENSKTEIVHNINVVRENTNTSDSQSKYNQTNNQTRDNQKTTVHNVTETFKTPRDEEAFRLAQQPGKVISTQVDLANPTTRVITEKKELTDGTIVTTKRYETITSDNVNKQSTQNNTRDNIESQNVKKTVQNTNQSTNVNKTNTQRNENVVDDNSRREIVEETVTKKLFDTSCHCPEMDHKNHSRNPKEFVNNERDEYKPYDVNMDIITTDDRKVKQNNNTFAENEKRNEDVVRRRENNYSEPTRREDQVKKENRPDYINKKISVELDASHKAFASSLRCVTPPNGRISTPSSSRNEIRSQRSPSRETTSSRISSATTTLRKNSGDFMKPTKSSDLRSSVKGSSPEKQPKKVYKDTLEKTTVVDTEVVNKTTTRDGRPAENPRNSRDKSPKNAYPGTADTRGKSPQKVQPSVTSGKPRESSPQKSHPAGILSSPRDNSPDKKHPSREGSSPHDKSPQKSRPAGISSSSRDNSPDKSYPSREGSSPRDNSPQKSRPTGTSSSPRDNSPDKKPQSREGSLPRDSSPQKSRPAGISSSPRDNSPDKSYPSRKGSSPRDNSPQKSRPTGTSSSPRDNSPDKLHPSREGSSPRDNSPQKSRPAGTSSSPRDNSPDKSYPSREGSPPQKSIPDSGVVSKPAGVPSRPRDNSPNKAYPGSDTPNSRDKSPQKVQPSGTPSKSRDGSPQKSTQESEKPSARRDSPQSRDNSPQKSQPSRENSSPRDHPVESLTSPRDKSPQKGYTDTGKTSPRDNSPLKTQAAKIPTARDSSPQKGTTGIFRNPNDSASQKYQPTTELSYPCDKSPEPSLFGQNTPIEILQQKYQPAPSSKKAFPGLDPISTKGRKPNEDERTPSQNSGQSTPRDKSPNCSDSGSSTPRGMSPLTSLPEFENSTPRNQSPQKSQPASRGNSPPKHTDSVKSSPRDSSPYEKPSRPESGNSTPRDKSPQKSNEKPSRPDSGNFTPRDRSPQKSNEKPSRPDSGNSTPRDRSPQKSNEKPSRPDSGNFTPRDSSPQKSYEKPSRPDSGNFTPRDSSPQKSNEKPSRPESGNSTPRDRSPQKSNEKPSRPDSGNFTPRDSSPQKSYEKPSRPESGNSTPRDRSPQKSYEKPSRPESGNSTPRDRSPQKPTHDSSRKTTQIDKRISPTTSVSDLEYFTSDPRLVTDLDYEDNEETQVDYESQTETYEETSTTTDRRFLNKKKPQEEKPSDVKGSTKKPTEKAPFNRIRSETFEERASKLIGNQTEKTERYDSVLKKGTKPSSPTKSAPDANTYPNRVSEIRERKAKIEKETANIEKITSTKKKSITSSSTDFINRERMEQRIPKDRITSSPDQSPERGSTRNTEIKNKTNIRTTINDDVTQSKMTTNTIKTSKVTREPSAKQAEVPSYLKPTETARRRMTSEDEQTLNKSPIKNQSRPKTSDETSEPKNHISVAKINISPIRGSVRTTTKSTYDKTINETSKTLKIAPSIMLVKKPITDVSSTEPDSDQEYDHELMKNVDKLSTKTIRKKLIQNRKDSAPVVRTTEKEKISRSTSENVFKSDTSTLKRRTSKDTPTKESSPKKDMKRPVKCVTTKTINLTAVNDNKSFNSNTLDDVIIHVQQAKSSREPSPNKSVPIPVRPDEIINEKQTIYPDSVTEPDDDRKFKPKQRVTNIPIFEEKTNQYVGLEITEVETNINELLEEDEDEEIDEETERSIINSFTLEKADRKRNSIQIDAIDDDATLDENEEEEIRQMSVSAKVNKFMSTAEEVKRPKSSAPFKPDEINIEDISEPEDDSLLSVNQKRNKFSKPADKTSAPKPTEAYRKTVSRTRDEVDESLIEDECLLSVSDKVSKFISTAEKLASSTPQRSPELVKNIMRQTSRPQYEDDMKDNLQDFSRNKETVSTLTKDDRSDSRSTLRSETSQITLKSTEAIKRAREVFESNSTANRDIARHSDIMSRPSVFEAKRTPNAERKVYKDTTPASKNLQERRSSRDRQSHSPVKETSSPLTSKAPVERAPASRGEPKEHLSVKKDLSSPKTSAPARIVDDRRNSRDRQSQSPNRNQGSETPNLSRKVTTDRTPGYLKDQVSSKKDLFEKKISSSRIETSDNMSYHQKPISPQTSVDEDRMGETHYTSRKTSQTGDKPSYMCHTVASREHINAERSESETRETRTSRRDSDTRHESGSRLSNFKNDRNVSESTNDSTMHQFDEYSKAPKSPTKFGVELKRTDSSRNTQTTTTSARKISASGDTFDVEEIFDLVELERLMESVVGYEQRRCIRAQIRVVKKMIADKKMSTSSSTSRNERVSTTNYSKNASSPTRKSRDEPSLTQSKVTQSRVPADKPVHERITRDDSRLSSKSTEMSTRYTSDRATTDRYTTDRATTDRFNTNRPTTDRATTDRATTDRGTTDRYNTDRATTDRYNSNRATADRATTDSRLSQNKTVTSRTTDKNTPTTPRGIIESLNKNNKGKVESAVKTTKKSTTSSSTSSYSSHSKMRESSEQAKETDCITSSYGVGPTDSNGLPLFGLRALKKKNPSVTTESKMSGSMVSEVSYSENGQPAKVERKSMKYSTDPTDFDQQEIDMDYKTNSSERKSSRGGIYTVTKTDKFQEDSKKKSVTSPSAKVIRRGSVKELKDKFVRKDSSSRVTESSSTSQNKRTSVDYDDYSGSEGETYSVCKESRTSSSSKSFLNSNNKATNVQEVLTYMRNADNVQEDGDTKDDAEARALLNKFLGATALMSGIESKSGLTKEYLSGGGSSSRNQNVSSSSKVTSSKTVKSSSATRKSSNIEEIWDSDTLKQLLDSTTNYDERRKIRAQLRQIMADKEVCAEIVKSLTAELDANSIANSNQIEEGESLLLPLIQGILQNPKYLLNLNQSKNANYASTASRGGRMSSELSNHLNGRLGNDANNYLPIVEDSGTESGEDLRLLAAGLQNNLKRMENEQQLANGDYTTSSNPLLKGNNDALGTGLLMEVTTALERLQNSLNLGEIDLEESKKVALLNLVARLQRGLISPEKIVESNADTDSAISNHAASPVEGLQMEDHQGRRGSSGANRFAKRRNREKRHTVGVSREELADARRIIEELELISTMPTTKPKITATVVNSTPGVYNAILTRQFSEPITLLRPSQFVPKEANQHIDITGKSKYRFLLKQSVSLDQPTSILKNTVIKHEPIVLKKMDQFPVEEKTHPPAEFKSKKFTSSVLQRTLSNTNNKFGGNIKNTDNGDDSDGESSSSDDDGEEMTNTKFYQNNKFKAKDNYLRNQQHQPQENVNAFNYSSGDETSGGFNRQSKYTSKKMKMKRANTVDLPKSYSFVNTFDLSDKECSDNETMRNTYQNRATGLKTTITGGSGFGSTKQIAPKFTPKTENDHKFLAFIQKQNQNVTPSWINPTAEKSGGRTQNWTNKFGNLKNRFEGDEPKELLKPQQKETSSSAANFWKTIEKEKPSAKVSPLPPIPNPVKMPTSTEKFPWKSSQEKLIRLEDTIQKKKPMMDKFEPKAQPIVEKTRSIPEPNKLPVSKPIMVNQFSHAPMSAFKPPISKKLMSSFKPIQPMEETIKKPMPTISNGIVKQMAVTGYSMNNQVIEPRKRINSPTRMIADSSYIRVKKPVKVEEAPQPTPWAGRAKSDRVMSIATSKFEQNQPTVTFSQQLQHVEPTVKLRSNPLYNGSFEKRSSLPPNASYASFDPIAFDIKPKSNQDQSQKALSFQKVCFSPPPPVVKPTKKEDYTFVITDFTQPTSVSTYIPHDEKFNRRDSLTNPAEEPIVLTCNRTMISPGDKQKPFELYDISTTPTPLSSQISNDHSTISNDNSFCEELDNEMKDLDSVEHRAVSRVMKAPVISTAFTQSSELHNLNDSHKENSMVKNLQDSLKKFSQKSPTPQDNTINKFSPKSPTPPEKRVLDTKRLSQDSTSSSNEYKLTSLKFPPKIDINKRPKEFTQQLSQDSSNSSIDFSPPVKVPFPAQPETSYSFTYASAPKIQVKSPSIDPPAHIVYNNTNNRAAYNPVPAHIHAQQHSHMLQKAKSTHMLAIPKPSDKPKPQIVMTEKQKTVSAYFTGNKIEAPVAKPSFNAASYVKPATFNNEPVSSQSSSITRKSSLYTKTASKPAQRQNSMGSLSRSRTMPSLANVDFLDESNIDDAFEELLSSTNL